MVPVCSDRIKSCGVKKSTNWLSTLDSQNSKAAVPAADVCDE